MKKLTVSIMALALTSVAFANNIDLKVKPERETYRCGETATFSVTVIGTNGAPLKAGTVRASMDNFGVRLVTPTNEFDLAKANPFTVSGTLKEPGFLRLVLNSSIKGFPVTQYCNGEWYAAVGFEPEKLEPCRKCPEDFDRFWADGRAELAKLPLDAKVEPSKKWSNHKWDVWGVSFATLDGLRVYGWLSKEKGVTNRLPARVQVAAAGFGGWSQGPQYHTGFVNLFMTVYPFSPDPVERKPDYDALNALCKRFFGTARYCAAGITLDDPRKYYFYPVLLGIDRAVDWLAKRDDVDPAHIVYSGTSQGGGFGFYLVALNRNFCKAAINVPALTDHYSHLAGRDPGWPDFATEVRKTGGNVANAERNAAYYDGVNFAARITVPVIVTCGTSDAACHPHCVWTAFNQIKSKDKRIWTGFAMTHSVWPAYYGKSEAWLKE